MKTRVDLLMKMANRLGIAGSFFFWFSALVAIIAAIAGFAVQPWLIAASVGVLLSGWVVGATSAALAAYFELVAEQARDDRESSIAEEI